MLDLSHLYELAPIARLWDDPPIDMLLTRGRKAREHRARGIALFDLWHQYVSYQGS